MELNPLSAISPVDGRYRQVSAPLAEYLSEFGLMRYRVMVEAEYFIALSHAGIGQLKPVDGALAEKVRDVYRSFKFEDANAIKQTEKTTNHDVKAVEYFLKDKLSALGLGKYSEFVHFGLTSQDVNNTAIPASLKDATERVVMPAVKEILDSIQKMAVTWRDVPMLARTHGQPASPTSLGKELYVFAERLTVQMDQLTKIPFSAKFGGATGNFNAHHVAYPATDWNAFADRFVNETLGLQRSRFTTQIEHYDNIAAYCDALKRINTILTDLCRDAWSYISLEYFKQKLKEGEVGSSAMPHKVNPIDFENAEGNLGLANAMFEFLSAKLPVSRLQRDLTDSTVLRNIGVPLAHSLISYRSIGKGLSKLILNAPALERDLEANWAVLAEAVQTILRREGYPKPYEALKALTRTNSLITRKELHAFIEKLEVSPEVKHELLALTPSGYIGIIPEFGK